VGQYGVQPWATAARRTRFKARNRASLEGAISQIDRY
jgi:hypothetical protein